MAKFRIKRWIILFLLLLVALSALLAAIKGFVLPGFVERQIVAALQDAGLTNASVRLGDLTFSHAVLKDLSFDSKDEYRVDSTRVHYTIYSIQNFQVDSLVLSGLQFKIGWQDTVLDLGPLNNLKSVDGSTARLPFQRLRIHNSLLILDWESKRYRIPVNAGLQMIGSDSANIDVAASLENSPLELAAQINVNSLFGKYSLQSEGIETTFLQTLADKYFPEQPVTIAGKPRLSGNFIYHKPGWKTNFTLDGEGLLIQTKLATYGLDVALKSNLVTVDYTSGENFDFILSGLLNRAPLNLTGNGSLASQEGQYEFDISSLPSRDVEKMIRYHLQSNTPEISGKIAAAGKISQKKDDFRIVATIGGKNMEFKSVIFEQDWQISHPAIETKITLALPESGPYQIAGNVNINTARLKNDSLQLSIADVSLLLPFSINETTTRISSADFTLKNILYDDQSYPEFSGKFSLENDSFRLKGNGNVLPEAEASVSGEFNVSEENATGELRVQIPQFHIKSGKRLAKQFPALNADKLGGNIAIDVTLKFERGEMQPHLRLDIQDGTWKNNEFEATLSGIDGTLIFDSFFPLTTGTDQQLSIETAKFNSFETKNGIVVFRMLNDDSVLFKSVETHWAKGRLNSQNFIYESGKPSINFILAADSLDLQAILDFFEYDGVKGDGKLYGQVPLKISWKKKTRIGLGEGLLESRPQNGRLKFSKETAITILGLPENPTPKSTNQVMLMTLDALQDLQYSTLRIMFTEKIDKVKTQVLIKGYGPLNDPDNQIPIGGFTVNINDLELLLNSILLPY